MNDFLKSILEDRETKSDDAYKNIVNLLMVKNAHQGEKIANTFGAYDSETLFNGKIYRGNIYIFEYVAKSPSKYSYKGLDVFYYDNMPVVLVIAEQGNCIKGINLNFCNKGLKALILNMFCNLDYEFYCNGLDEKLANNKQLVISEKVYKFLSNDNAQEIIVNNLKSMYKDVDYNMIFRNYNVNNIKNLRLIEPWLWKDIPFLTYTGSLKGETLDAIQKISGINNIKI